MTIYLIQWTTEAERTKRLASASSREVQTRYKELIKDPHIEVLLQDDEAIIKHTVSTQTDVINLINSLK